MELSFNMGKSVENYAAAGAAKTKKPTVQLVLLGILAGFLIAIAAAATNTAVHGIPEVWTAKTICGLLFPFGLGTVILCGAELFTGNNLIVISVLSGRCGWRGLLRNWIVVYLANFAGSLLVAAGCAFFGQLSYSGNLLAVTTMKTALAKVSLPFGNALVLGILCNILVCLAVLMAGCAKDVTGKILAAFLPICFFVLCGFEHSVANMYYIGAGLFAKLVPAYAQSAAQAGLDLSALTWGSFLVRNLLPVTLGNILGGTGVGWVMWKCYRAD